MGASPGQPNILADAKSAIDTGDLILDGHSHPGDLVRMVASQATATEQDLSLGRALLTGHAPEQRAFAGTIRSDQASELAFGNREVDIVHRRDPAKAACEPTRLQDRPRGHVRLSSRRSVRSLRLKARANTEKAFGPSRSVGRMPRGTSRTKKMMIAPNTRDVLRIWLVPR